MSWGVAPGFNEAAPLALSMHEARRLYLRFYDLPHQRRNHVICSKMAPKLSACHVRNSAYDAFPKCLPPALLLRLARGLAVNGPPLGFFFLRKAGRELGDQEMIAIRLKTKRISERNEMRMPSVEGMTK